MHPTAVDNARRFFETYLPDGTGRTIVEIGAGGAGTSLRSLCPAGARYVAADIAAGGGIDVVMEDPYRLPFDDGSVDACLASSVLEHVEFFWLLFEEVLRVLRPEGLFYLNVPSNGPFHRHPVDCWRFYPDSGRALAAWGRRRGYDPVLLESFVAWQRAERWNDFVAVFVRDASRALQHPWRIADRHPDAANVLLHGTNEFRNLRNLPEDLMRLEAIRGIAAGTIGIR